MLWYYYTVFMLLSKIPNITERDLKSFVAKWLEQQGVRYCFQEFQFIRRPDLLAVDFDENYPRLLYKIFLHVPFDYLASNFTKKSFPPEDIAERFGLNLIGFRRNLNILVNHGYLAKSKAGYRVIRTETFLSRLVTVECKIRDWRQGLKQAITYKMLFSQESYLALPQIYVKNVDETQFKKQGIGLLSIDEEGNVRQEIAPKNKVKSYYRHSASASIVRSLRAKTLKKVEPVS